MTFQPHSSRWLAVCVLVAVLLLLAGSLPAFAGSFAGLAVTNFAFNGTVNTQPGHDSGYWRGGDSYGGVASLYSNTVEFAVFAPGGSFGSFLGQTDPTSGTEWVYAFQVQLDADTYGMGLFALNAGLDTGAGVNTISWVSGTGDASPSTALFNVNSAEWNWTSPVLGLGDFSDVLYYTSNFAPQKDFTSTEANVTGDQGQSLPKKFASPSAVPEPASVLLVFAGLMSLAVGRWRRTA